MRLALACGRGDWRRFANEISSEDVAWWLAYERVDGPIGLARLDQLVIWLACAMQPMRGNSPIPEPYWWKRSPEPVEIVTDDEEVIEAKRKELDEKVMRMFGQPDG
jgi:hypothetical protein